MMWPQQENEENEENERMLQFNMKHQYVQVRSDHLQSNLHLWIPKGLTVQVKIYQFDERISHSDAVYYHRKKLDAPTIFLVLVFYPLLHLNSFCPLQHLNIACQFTQKNKQYLQGINRGSASNEKPYNSNKDDYCDVISKFQLFSSIKEKK